ncbi:2-phosphosulfolactate phosphatase [Microbacterium sp. EYE_5]|uniref:2-phosphosulfolactate phosphatase n=1 Tax=unclassified Microbacterium TaxID=2609290 RepID=UPI002004A0C1|nr:MULTISPECIES: 2-phosphosulfolactate phosphatase [unclassified Microbacterium]MCK6079933.1 2-phosphosulfolactate phosphatase [Microbacterium sp. EYE_382]MCK6085204.1 2-phosphosulfolactate phosphatase [Microbacterium sp. EYE_384]MCK6122570.1 2-phosphosulfolactate phosphatase [Microbacterium sp. EYE_80]MCK6125967.1 2-phosphosulfolactate phosphatase [Microbacterium sp. EYE_79]MCK6140888.1 2-phosphosulfolactate phosphatase [Microbacterium sp. EYE_39]
MTASAFDQSRYQLRFDWGVAGLRRLAPADVVVVVDVLRFSSTVSAQVAGGEAVPHGEAAHEISRNGAAVASAAADAGAVVFAGCLRNATAVARAVLAEQNRRAARTSVNVIAAGELAGHGDTAVLRFSVEDQLGAGAVFAALESLGLDHSSPEAAAASEAFRGLRSAVRHLLTASGSGQELLEAGNRAEVQAAAAHDADDAVPVLRGDVWRAYPFESAEAISAE